MHATSFMKQPMSSIPDRESFSYRYRSENPEYISFGMGLRYSPLQVSHIFTDSVLPGTPSQALPERETTSGVKLVDSQTPTTTDIPCVGLPLPHALYNLAFLTTHFQISHKRHWQSIATVFKGKGKVIDC